METIEWCWNACTFGHYSSYMELAFAINILIAGWWDNIYDNLSDRMKSEGESQDLAMLGVEVDASIRGDLKRERNDLGKRMGVMVLCLKILCFTLGVLIAAALMMIAGTSKISFWWMPWILALPIFCSGCVIFWGVRERRKVDEKIISIIVHAAQEAGKAKDLSNKR